MTAIVLRGDARELPLPDGSVDLIVTSPPYFGLRSYTDGGEHYDGQIGSEATPAEWLAALVECTREWVRVLKPQGSLFVNLGDKYNSSGGTLSRGAGGSADRLGTKWAERTEWRAPALPSTPQKSLLGLPWRYALACTDQLGLILRAEIIWAKPNGLPESVTDRVRRSHEVVFHFTRQPRYYAAVDEIREAHTGTAHGGGIDVGNRSGNGVTHRTFLPRPGEFNALGKLPGSVWSIPSQPLTVPDHLGIDHFAAFPMELPRRLILGWSPPGVCVACGEGRRPVRGADPTAVHIVEKRALTDAERTRFAELFCRWQEAKELTGKDIASLFPSRTGGLTGCVANWRAGNNVLTPEQAEVLAANFGPLPPDLTSLVNSTRSVGYRSGTQTRPRRDVTTEGRHRSHVRMGDGISNTITGYACACPEPTAPTRPAIVLDPFGGTGTTALVATMHGRTGITIDRSADYSRLAAWRTTDPAQRAAALGVPKPPPIPDGMEPLFEVGP